MVAPLLILGQTGGIHPAHGHLLGKEGQNKKDQEDEGQQEYDGIDRCAPVVIIQDEVRK